MRHSEAFHVIDSSQVLRKIRRSTGAALKCVDFVGLTCTCSPRLLPKCPDRLDLGALEQVGIYSPASLLANTA